MKLANNINIDFQNEYHKYNLIISNLDNFANYSIHLYIDRGYPTLLEEDEVFSTWIDSSGGEVSGNCEVYKIGYDKVIDYCYQLFNNIMRIM